MWRCWSSGSASLTLDGENYVQDTLEGLHYQDVVTITAVPDEDPKGY